MRRILRFIKAISLCILVQLSLAVSAFAEEDRELSLTAAFIYNFAKYTEWQAGRFEDPAEPFLFCYFSSSAVASHLPLLEGRKIRECDVSIKTIESLSEAKDCAVLYVDSRPFKKQELGSISALVVGRDIDTADIKLFVSRDVLQFSIDTESAQNKGLKFRSQLLKIAAEPK